MSPKRFWGWTLASLAVATLVLGWVGNRIVVEQRIAEAEEFLLLQNNLRREVLTRYLDTAEAELRFWSTNPELVGYQRFLSLAWDEAVRQGVDPEQALRDVYINNNPYPPGQRGRFIDEPQQSPYRTMHSQLHPLTRRFVTERGYYDFFLIDPDGHVSYSVEKEDDFGTSLVSGPYRDTGLGQVFRRAMAGEAEDQVVYSDFESYAPSNGDPAMFMANAMHDSDGSLIGVLAFQLPTDRIAHIMDAARAGSTSGEAYIVGEDGRMRSQSRFSNASTVLKTEVDTAPARRALDGEYGVTLAKDYRGVEVYSAYSNVIVDEHQWGLLVEIDRAEVLERASGQRGWLAGILLLLYGLGAWSAWYLRGADADADAVFGGFDPGMDSGD